MSKEPDQNDPENNGLSHDETQDVETRQRLRAPVVDEIIRSEGEEELTRPVSLLWWSGIAAGVGISTSVVAEGLLHGNLPDSNWRPLVENFGY